MPSFRSAQTQADKAVNALTVFGTAKHTAEEKTGIHSVGTAKTYAARLALVSEWLDANGLKEGLHRITPELANAYLVERREAVSQSTLDGDRQALQAVLGEKLPVTRSQRGRGSLASHSRHYTDRQVELIAASQQMRNRLATQVAQAAGLRAHELLTLRRTEERGPSKHRVWSRHRFLGREVWVRYTAKGKGGLIREVVLPPALAEALEAARLEYPKTVMDRGIPYEQHYAIGGGHAWSQSFSGTSKSQLGWSTGGHSLRHRYAQDRMGELQGRGLFYREALEIVSQELGHFRADITEVYLR